MSSREPDHDLVAERALVARLRVGNDDAGFEQLVRQFGGRMHAAIRRVLGNEEEARDALQDAFLAVHRGIATFAGDARLSTWLHRVALNAALMRLRHRRCRPETSLDELLPTFTDDGHHHEPPCPFGDQATQQLETEENRVRVRAAIDSLPPTYREIVLLRDLEELTTDATAELLGISGNAVKIRLHRARQALRTLLEPYMSGGSL